MLSGGRAIVLLEYTIGSNQPVSPIKLKGLLTFCPPSRVKGRHPKEALIRLERVMNASKGTLKKIPLSNEPSPNISAGTLVLVAHAPILEPLLKTFAIVSVAPRSPAKY